MHFQKEKTQLLINFQLLLGSSGNIMDCINLLKVHISEINKVINPELSNLTTNVVLRTWCPHLTALMFPLVKQLPSNPAIVFAGSSKKAHVKCP